MVASLSTSENETKTQHEMQPEPRSPTLKGIRSEETSPAERKQTAAQPKQK